MFGVGGLGGYWLGTRHNPPPSAPKPADARGETWHPTINKAEETLIRPLLAKVEDEIDDKLRPIREKEALNALPEKFTTALENGGDFGWRKNPGDGFLFFIMTHDAESGSNVKDDAYKHLQHPGWMKVCKIIPRVSKAKDRFEICGSSYY